MYSYICAHCRHYATPSDTATPAPAPALLLKLRSDLKTAMQQKDKPRLNVLRGVLAEVTNAAKTNKPIQSDMQLLSLLRKRAAAAKTASAEFSSAGRQDLVETEEQQARIMEDYAGGVEVMSGEGLREAVQKVVEEVKRAAGGKATSMGDVLKRLIGPGGTLDGKPVEKVEVSRLVKEMMGKAS
ncbi:hypothetical protein LTR78_001674 [Recurvomyces mirabilis]|uniref:Altered inheritance of mitochondria protein 41 n=1 Tax=Recurvomyces mirabilis TaxID=574656 RepID=A0AAE1C522_9PEZI|nr:hypothetical protein LTR78_001674 [Recurvomyces mirabilis]KAK5151756.1 hypothetical protein LTS14_008888 [Recurvomyces mirabilis]